VGKSAQDLVLGEITALGTNLIYVMPGGSDEDAPPASVMGIITTTLKEKDFRALRKLPHVAVGSPFVQSQNAVTLDQYSISTEIVGASEELADVLDIKVGDGRFFGVSDVSSYARVAVIGSQVASDLRPVGGTVIGETIRIKDVSFQVIGVLDSRGTSLGMHMDKAVFVPVTAMQKSLLGIDYVQTIAIKVDDAKNLSRLKSDIEEELRRRHHIKDNKDDFSVRMVASAIKILGSVTSAISAFLVMVTAVSLVVGGINIMNIMYVAVRERTREIGLRKALGARPRRIMVQFLTESAIIAFMGGLIGLALGAAIAYGINLVALANGLTWNFMISGTSVAISLFVSIGIGLTFGVGPALAASRLDAIEALRYE
jgi:putative ABC transport system permease protein